MSWLGELCGLNPRTVLAVTGQVVREEVKAVILKEIPGLVSSAIVGTTDLASQLLAIDRDRVLLSASARQEILRLLFQRRGVSALWPEMTQLKRQPGFFRKLDRALQSGRMAFAHEGEFKVLTERAEQLVGKNPLRRECILILREYEEWLVEHSLWDPPLLLRAATQLLEETWPAHCPKPERIRLLASGFIESREEAFWSALARHVPMERVLEKVDPRVDTPVKMEWERWHSLDDGVEGLMDELQGKNDEVVLFLDQPPIRRCLRRGFAERKIAQADPRDPEGERLSEGMKSLLAPLEAVARGYEKEAILHWAKVFLPRDESNALGSELHSRGFVRGWDLLQRYLSDLSRSKLQRLSTRFQRRMTLEECSRAHLQILSELRGEAREEWNTGIRAWERIWNEFAADLARLELENRRAPLLYWLERVRERWSESINPPDLLRTREGTALFRLQQPALPAELDSTPVRKLWVFGVDGDWLADSKTGDYFWSQTERDALSLEFQIQGKKQIREAKLSALLSWINRSGHVKLIDATYSPEGAERTSPLSLFVELGFPFREHSDAQERGAHPRWLPSHGAVVLAQPTQVRLSQLVTSEQKPVLSATLLDRYSRCPFQALADHRWKLADLKISGPELWPDARGRILHAAIRLLIESRERVQEGTAPLTSSEALEQAWTEGARTGLHQGTRLEGYLRRKYIEVLDLCLEKEQEYRKRSGARPIVLDDQKLAWEGATYRIEGKPDRIDEHPDGLFIIDYKTSSAAPPSGEEVLRHGLRLQLPFYAIATRKHYSREVLGVQFVELNSKGSRTHGLFPKKYNGKESGKLTHTRSKSVLALEPEEIWAQCESWVDQHAKQILSGVYDAHPKIEKKECPTCPVGRLCGYRRRLALGAMASGERDETDV